MKRAVLVAAAFVAGACDMRTELPTFSLDPGAFIAAFVVDGRLVHNPATNCVELLLATNERLALMWAPGFTSRLDPVRIYNENGLLVASESEHVFLEASAGGPAQPRCGAEESLLVYQVAPDLSVDPD
jgi:hypothetical protein